MAAPPTENPPMLGLGSRALGAVSPRMTPLPCFSIMRAAAVMVMKYDLTRLKEYGRVLGQSFSSLLASDSFTEVLIINLRH